MRAIIFKELRENAKWALLMLLGLAAAMAYAIYTDHSGFSLVSSAMEMVTGLGFPVVGFALGLLQILQDQRRGRWEFLTHRPISRTEIFFAKVLAGAALYLLAATVPLAAVTGWVATPGHLAAPFDWHMVLPRLGDLFEGLMWYATGLLVAARKARWIGSRLMPIGLALIVAVLAWALPLNFWEALLILSGGILVILPAAWATFDAGGIYESQPAITRFLQVINVEAGLALCVLLVTAILISLIQFLNPGPIRPYEAYRIDVIGRVLRHALVSGRYFLQGRGVGATVGDPSLAMAYLSLQGYPSEESPWQERRTDWGLQGSDPYIRYLGYGNYFPWTVQWFYVVQRRTIEGFDGDSHRFIGSIGPNGFVPAPQPAPAFPDPIYPQSFQSIAPGRTAAYRLDLNRHEIHAILKTTPQDPILAIGPLYKHDQYRDTGTVIVTNNNVHILQNDHESCRIPMEHSAPYSLAIGQTRDGRFILFYTIAYDDPSHRSDWVVEADPHGQIVRRTGLAPLPPSYTGDPWWIEGVRALAWPPFLLVIIAFTRGLIDRVDVAVVSIMAVASARAVVPLCRRYVLDRRATILWIIAALLLGLPGVLALLSLRQLPARTICPSCGKPRVVTREACEHCGAPVGRPPMHGIEVFEMAS